MNIKYLVGPGSHVGNIGCNDKPGQTADNASAVKKVVIKKNEAVSQSNDCGNAEGFPLTLRLTIYNVTQIMLRAII